MYYRVFVVNKATIYKCFKKTICTQTNLTKSSKMFSFLFIYLSLFLSTWMNCVTAATRGCSSGSCLQAVKKSRHPATTGDKSWVWNSTTNSQDERTGNICAIRGRRGKISQCSGETKNSHIWFLNIKISRPAENVHHTKLN